MIRKLIFGFIFSIILLGYIWLVLYLSNINEALKELSFYYLSIGDKQLSNSFNNGYYYFNNLLLFVVFLVVPVFKLLNNLFIKHNIFYIQFGMIYLLLSLINRLINQEFQISFILFILMVVFLMGFKIIINEFKGKSNLIRYIKLTQVEVIYYLLLIGTYFFLLNRVQNLSDLFVTSMNLIALFLTIIVPYFYKKQIRIEKVIFFKPLCILIIVLIGVLFINETNNFKRHFYLYHQFPNQIILNEDTTFNDFNSKNCDIPMSYTHCDFRNRNHVFDDYYLDQATILISSKPFIEWIDKDNYLIELHFHHNNKDEIFVIDRYQLYKDEKRYYYMIDFKQYDMDYSFSNSKYVSIKIKFKDLNTNEYLYLRDYFISDIEIVLTKYQDQ